MKSTVSQSFICHKSMICSKLIGNAFLILNHFIRLNLVWVNHDLEGVILKGTVITNVTVTNNQSVYCHARDVFYNIIEKLICKRTVCN